MFYCIFCLNQTVKPAHPLSALLAPVSSTHPLPALLTPRRLYSPPRRLYSPSVLLSRLTYTLRAFFSLRIWSSWRSFCSSKSCNKRTPQVSSAACHQGNASRGLRPHTGHLTPRGRASSSESSAVLLTAAALLGANLKSRHFHRLLQQSQNQQPMNV